MASRAASVLQPGGDFTLRSAPLCRPSLTIPNTPRVILSQSASASLASSLSTCCRDLSSSSARVSSAAGKSFLHSRRSPKTARSTSGPGGGPALADCMMIASWEERSGQMRSTRERAYRYPSSTPHSSSHRRPTRTSPSPSCSTSPPSCSPSASTSSSPHPTPTSPHPRAPSIPPTSPPRPHP
ncbi:unnamed protein product [Closterium sp. NIES-54]